MGCFQFYIFENLIFQFVQDIEFLRSLIFVAVSKKVVGKFKLKEFVAERQSLSKALFPVDVLEFQFHNYFPNSGSGLRENLEIEICFPLPSNIFSFLFLFESITNIIL